MASNDKHRRHSGFYFRLKQSTRSLRYAFWIPFLECCRILFRFSPHAAVLAFGRFLGRLAMRFDSKGRRRAEAQLRQTAIADSPQSVARITRQVYEQLGMNVVEWLHTLHWPLEKISRQVQFDGAAIIESAGAHGRGIIFVSAHMGNWELLPRVYRAATGEPLAAVMAETSTPEMTRWMIKWREFGGAGNLIPAGEALAIIRYLRRRGALALLADQDSTRSRGIFVDFFGRPAYTPVGPATLARRTGAPLVPAVIVRDAIDPRLHRVLMAPPILPDAQLDEETDIQRMTQAFTSIIEGWIRQHPHQWVWVHERWRHQPGKKIRIRSSKRPAMGRN